jgi:hypothetical protein
MQTFEEQFEKWIKEIGDPLYDSGCTLTEFVKAAWLASRKAALEECIRIAKRTTLHLSSTLAPYNHGVMDATNNIADAIGERMK